MINKIETITYVIGLNVLMVFVLIADSRSSYVNGILGKLNLIPKQEKFTELYFDDYSKLPTKSIAGQEVSFSFTISNFEGEDVTYPYKVYFEYPSGYKSVIKTGQITAYNNESKSILVNHKFGISNLYGKVVVHLENVDQTIHFLLPNYN
mgnify:FL=1